MNGLNGLQSLLKLQGPSNFQNVAKLGQPGLDAVSADADLLPSEGELKAAQQTVSGATGVGVSRQELSDSSMASLRRKLGLQQRETDIETGARTQLMDREAGHAMDRQRVAADAQLRSTQIAANSRAEQAEAAAAQKEALLNALMAQAGGDRSVTLSGVGSVGAPPRASAGGNRTIPQGLLKQIQTAEDEYGGTINKLWRGIGLPGDAGRSKLVQALQAGLSNEGSLEGTIQGIKEAKTAGLATAEEAIADMKANGVPLTPYQERFIQLSYGQ